MTLTMKEGTLRFSPDIIEELGGRQYFHILINPEEKKLCLKACDENAEDVVNISSPVHGCTPFIERLRETFKLEEIVSFEGYSVPIGVCFDLDHPLPRFAKEIHHSSSRFSHFQTRKEDCGE